jgi:hypothetical protein
MSKGLGLLLKSMVMWSVGICLNFGFWKVKFRREGQRCAFKLEADG